MIPRMGLGGRVRGKCAFATMPCEGLRTRARGGQMRVAVASYRPYMPPAHEKSAAVTAAVASLTLGEQPPREILRSAVRSLLSELSAKAPGRSVEVRVPPYGAIQCVVGPRHTRGTPANVVEMDPVTFIELAAGLGNWSDAVRDGRIQASGNRADISHLFPIRDS
jgi:hypothetical protein